MGDFSTVEELAFLIKDNLSCKHLVLSVQEMLIDSLKNNANSDEVIELEPMSSYHRLMLHRLADIFGFAHESVGEGDDRHLILQKCPDSSIPLVLVSDILLQYDEYHPPTTSTLILKRESSSIAIKPGLASSAPSLPVEEREMAYLAARERIFSLSGDGAEEPVNLKPRPVPAAARRMIAHALGQRMSSSTPSELQESTVNCGEGSCSQRARTHERKDQDKVPDSSRVKGPPKASKNSNSGAEKLEKERAGAARRIFANALGLGLGRNNQSS